MRHNFLRRILGGILTGCILVTATVHAGTTQKDIDKAKDQITDLKKQKEDAKDQVDSLTNEKQGLESDLSGLNGQIKIKYFFAAAFCPLFSKLCKERSVCL